MDGDGDIDEGTRRKTLARFEDHRRAWQSNAALRTLYGRWYERVRQALPAPSLGPWIELGSGPGFAKEFIPELLLTDLVQAPWHDRGLSAQSLPFDPGAVGALVLFDVLHHLPAPGRFFDEATRVLAPGGRIVLCEPYISPVSYPVYKFLHDEPVQMGVDPLAEGSARGRDPFDANQAIPTLLFGRCRAEFERRFPSLRIANVERLAGLSYPSSGGLSRGPLLPMSLWRGLLALEDLLPSAFFRLTGFRLLAVIERI